MLSAVTREGPAAIGYTLPERIAPGFMLLSTAGSCDHHIPFDWLWDGRLNAELLAATRRSGADQKPRISDQRDEHARR